MVNSELLRRVDNLAPGQRLLQLGHACFRNSRAAEIQRLQLLECGQFLQAFSPPAHPTPTRTPALNPLPHLNLHRNLSLGFVPVAACSGTVIQFH
jgi:hypothetical protein